ncbi:capsule assembly Wzi family protein [Runella sp.]|uniref:capsule assembly Wzi family protein n=1 Tax=Runella sp. TaxID=1960881 RepID=UPI00260AACF7|nr:capsule assembly Wzi family protein [Runella sp.]
MIHSTTCSLCLFLILLIGVQPILAQDDSLGREPLTLSSEIGGSIATASETPFWLRVNQFGSVPQKTPFLFAKLFGEALVGLDPQKCQWSFRTEMMMSLNEGRHLVLPEAVITFQYRGLEIYAGRRKEIIGLIDTLLSSGSYSWSGTALPLPKIHIGTRGFLPLGFTKGFVSVQGTFAHGWFGKQQFTFDYYLHQKTAFFRLGKPKHKLKFFAGITHFAQWGGYAPYVGSGIADTNGNLPKSFRDFLYVVFATDAPRGNNLSLYDSENRVGNHVGSIDIALQYNKNNSDWLLYYQRPVENQAGIAHNFPDGLYGLRWMNKKRKAISWLNIQHITAEYLTTLDQNLSYDSKADIYRGDDYFNNSQYLDGWTYKQHAIGSPFISLRTDTRLEWFNLKGSYAEGVYRQINNSSVRAFYLGLQGAIKNNNQFKIRLSANFLYIDYNVTTGIYGSPINQLSGYFEYIRKIQTLKGSTISVIVAKDQGNWLSNSSAITIRFKQRFK